MTSNKLTEREHWDYYWHKLQLPAEVKDSEDNLLLNEELSIFRKFLPKEKLSVLELGGAPGQYLAFMHKQFGYKVSCLDYSETGCKKTIENLELLDIPVDIYQKDIFSDLSMLPNFDLVFSMGLIEHFNDPSLIIKKHLELVKPGGIVMFGLPNFRGINHFFLKRLAPSQLKQHNLKTMDIRSWTEFERKYKLKILFKGYIGGFEPATFLFRERKSMISGLYYLKARLLNKIFHNKLRFLRRYNSRHFSAYILGIYRKP